MSTHDTRCIDCGVPTSGWKRCGPCDIAANLAREIKPKSRTARQHRAESDRPAGGGSNA